MKISLLVLFLVAVCIAMVTAEEYGYNNPSLPIIEPPDTFTQTNINNSFFCLSNGTGCMSLNNVAFINNSQTFSGANTFNNTVFIDVDGNNALQFDGDSDDQISILGTPGYTGVDTGIGININQLVTPPAIDKEYWGISSIPLIIGTKNISEVIGIISAPFTLGGLNLYTATVKNMIGFSFEPQWITGNATNVYGFYLKEPNKVGGTWDNLYGLYLSNVTNGTNNFAIFTEKGAIRFGDNITAPNICYTNGTGCINQTYTAGTFNSTYAQFAYNQTIGSGSSFNTNQINNDLNITANITHNNIFLTGIIQANGTIGIGQNYTGQTIGDVLLWYPRKAAFRAGNFLANSLSEIQLANQSIALSGGIANATFAIAIGRGNATGSGGITIGNSHVIGTTSVGIGGCRVNGNNGICIGSSGNTNVTGAQGVAIGGGSSASSSSFASASCEVSGSGACIGDSVIQSGNTAALSLGDNNLFSGTGDSDIIIGSSNTHTNDFNSIEIGISHTISNTTFGLSLGNTNTLNNSVNAFGIGSGQYLDCSNCFLFGADSLTSIFLNFDNIASFQRLNVSIGQEAANTALQVNGTTTSTLFIGNGSGLSNVCLSNGTGCSSSSQTNLFNQVLNTTSNVTFFDTNIRHLYGSGAKPSISCDYGTNCNASIEGTDLGGEVKLQIGGGLVTTPRNFLTINYAKAYNGTRTYVIITPSNQNAVDTLYTPMVYGNGTGFFLRTASATGLGGISSEWVNFTYVVIGG